MKFKRIMVIGMLWVCASAAQAQTAGRLLLSAGWLHFAPQEKSGTLENVSPSATFNIKRIPVFGTDDGGISLARANSIGVSATYFLTDHWAGEFMLGIAPEWKLYGANKWSAMGKLGTVEQWSPALLLKYYFFDESSKWRPYAGIGLSRAWFTHAHFDNSLFESSFGDAATLSVSAKNTWNAVFNAGLMYQFQKHWFGGLSVYYMPLRAIATFDTHIDDGSREGHSATYESSIRINPILPFMYLGYRF
jgi:outer membrane protein